MEVLNPALPASQHKEDVELICDNLRSQINQVSFTAGIGHPTLDEPEWFLNAVASSDRTAR